MGVRGPRKSSAASQARRGNPGKRKAAPKKKPVKKAAPKKTAPKKAAPKKAAPKKASTKKQAAKKQTAKQKAATNDFAGPPPSWLGTVASNKWRAVFGLFDRRGVVTELDCDALAIYCDAWQELADADATLSQAGEFFTTDKGYVGQHPAVAKRNKAIDRIRKVGEALGLTPNSRRGLEFHQEADDPLSDFLGM